MTYQQIAELEQCVARAYAGAVSMIPSPPHKRALDAIAELRAIQDSGAGIISNERTRQIERKGYTPMGDARYRKRELITAARAYLKADEGFASAFDGAFQAAKNLIYKAAKLWPWKLNYFKPSEDRVRNLAKAGALIAAEIDRIKYDEGPSKVEITPADSKELYAQIR